MEFHQIERHPTEFQQPLERTKVERVLSRELKPGMVTKVTELSAGLFNNTYRVTTEQSEYVLKVAPAEEAEVFYNERFLMLREREIASQLQSLSPLIPAYLSFFKVDGRDAFLQPWIDGRLWDEVKGSLSDKENAELWRQLGVFAKTLHCYSGDKFGYPSPSDAFERWSEFIEDNVGGMIEDCRRLNILHAEITAYRDLLPHFSDRLDAIQVPKLLHGDLWPKNVLIGGSGNEIHLKAVFDAERAFWGDPAADWVLILFGVPEDFWDGYGEDLLQKSDPALIAIYRGMYFILNILETVRFNTSDVEPRAWLTAVNRELESYRSLSDQGSSET